MGLANRICLIVSFLCFHWIYFIDLLNNSNNVETYQLSPCNNIVFCECLPYVNRDEFPGSWWQLRWRSAVVRRLYTLGQQQELISRVPVVTWVCLVMAATWMTGVDCLI